MSQCPFIAAGRIERPDLFIGRKDELDFITNRMTSAQPTSVNVYGAKRIGKSSLLYHFFLTWEQRISPEDRKKFVVVYVSLESADCQQESGFYQQVAKVLCDQATIKNNPILQPVWAVSDWTRTAFNHTVEICKTEKVLPVLCLDNVETTLQHNQQFDEGFYSNLRSLMGNNSLMLIIASFELLKSPVYKEKYGLSSLFFNQGQTLELKGFNDAEVTEFLKIAEKAGMTAKQQKLIRKWGNHNPYHLQLAGELLCEGKGEDWAKREFYRQITSPPATKKGNWSFSTVGELADAVVKIVDSSRKTVTGLATIAMIIIAIFILILALIDHSHPFVQFVWNYIRKFF